ncbi:PEP/pyruvate-binding domain-containing protein [Nannocystis radixulma]|uniref:PEP/pyruvate-binding domain-containing protein n=1 Tax=Nannocystis radixulma TaxID=2995305 RepID=A0ABT5BFJ5_9BACT|nr:PEP/pyruvate-binding domain-containing protein [Nannocystis radixulma]MDC0672385.1 PEP/pyruvate-binding domain-containing protein [Nannocystis radixulma]
MSLHPRIVIAGRLALACAALSGCGAPTGTVGIPEKCLQSGDEAPEFVRQIGCLDDFLALASVPLDASLPGARSVKVVQDHADDDALYFQNSVLYPIHYDFVSTHLSGDPLPLVPQLGEFNTTEYYSPERRFNLAAVTYYEQPKVWAIELSPYDSASADMIAALYRSVAAESYFGGSLYFHPTSEAVASEAERLPADIPVITTDEIYAGIDYQPLSLGDGMGRLRFLKAVELETEYVSYQDILVLDEAPNDISVVQGLVTEEFQTPLSHVNVLSLNRKTPNMGLRGAMTSEELRAFEGKLVELKVDATAWSVREVTQAEAEAFWDEHRPEPVVLPALDLDVQELLDIEDVTPEPAEGESLREAIKTAVLAFGGKAAQYSILARTEDVPVAKAFAVPMYFYDQFMRDNGFYERIDALLADPAFTTDAARRDQELAQLRADMMLAPLDGAFQATLKAKLAADYPGLKMRFRTSTNSEDLDGFPCAGCYESHSGDPADWSDVLDAIRETYASIWLFRTFEERSYYGIAHTSVGMALLVHPNFEDEEANGVAVTGNPFDPSGLDPAFYVNVQSGGDVEVVAPPPGVTSDQFLYFFSQPNQPVSYLAHSSLIDAGETVLTVQQVHQLGTALDAIHRRFSPAYGPAAGNHGWYAMDVEFKFDDVADPGQPPTLYIKQARPYPGRGD